jgi:hypothetical protein
MKKTLTPFALLLALLLSVAAALPLAGTALLSLSLFGFMASLLGLAWWVINADVNADPRQKLARTAERWDEEWHWFERDFWAHVASREATHGLD